MGPYLIKEHSTATIFFWLKELFWNSKKLMESFFKEWFTKNISHQSFFEKYFSHFIPWKRTVRNYPIDFLTIPILFWVKRRWRIINHVLYFALSDYSTCHYSILSFEPSYSFSFFLFYLFSSLILTVRSIFFNNLQ